MRLLPLVLYGAGVVVVIIGLLLRRKAKRDYQNDPEFRKYADKEKWNRERDKFRNG